MFTEFFARLAHARVDLTTAPDAAPLYDRMHVLRLLYEEVHRTHAALVRWYLGARLSPTEQGGDPALFAAFRRALLEHPVAAQAAFRALVDEGRRAMETPEGQRDWEVLRRSSWLPRFRELWSELTLNVLEDRPATVVPSALLDLLHALVRAPEDDR